MNWERFFTVLGKINAIGIFLFLAAVLFFFALDFFSYYQLDQSDGHRSDGSDFGSEFERSNPIMGQSVQTSGGEIVAYYQEDGSNERKELAGLVLVHPKTGKQLEVAASADQYLVDFDFLYDQGREGGPVIGYIAKIASETDYKNGKADLVVGALPAMTKNVVAKGVQYSDLPQVRSDGVVGIILWQTEHEAEVVGFRLSDGSVVDRATIKLPTIVEDRVSQGPGRADDPHLARKPDMHRAPANEFGYWE